MPRPRSTQPTDRELEILHVLWEAGPQPLGSICAALRSDREVATTTVATMLGVMLEKDLVTRQQGSRGYVWTARISQEAATRGMLGRLIDRVFDGSAARLVAHLLEDQRLSPSERLEILELLKADRRSPGGSPR